MIFWLLPCPIGTGLDERRCQFLSLAPWVQVAVWSILLPLARVPDVSWIVSSPGTPGRTDPRLLGTECPRGPVQCFLSPWNCDVVRKRQRVPQFPIPNYWDRSQRDSFGFPLIEGREKRDGLGLAAVVS
jgi:hypothetical protein